MINLSNERNLNRSALEGLKDMWDSSRTEYDSEFNALVTQPFLTSSEQDELINQLRDANFFTVFSYDSKIGGWACSKCRPQNTITKPDGGKPSKSSVAPAPGSAPAREGIVTGYVFKRVGTSKKYEKRFVTLDEKSKCIMWSNQEGVSEVIHIKNIGRL